MSIRSAGQQRYGHVPPAQYGTGGAQGQGHNLQRQSSFDNDDDAPFFDPGNGGNQRATASASQRFSYMAEQELFLTSPSSQSTMSHASNSRESPLEPSSPAISGFQHQYQPFNDVHSPNAPQVQYNPQHFARTQSVSQPQSALYRAPSTFVPNPSYNPNPTYNPNSTYNPSSAYTLNAYSPPTPSFGAHQPYNPAAYQPPPPPHPLQRQGTVAGYNMYNSYPQQAQPPGQWSQASPQYGLPPAPRPLPNIHEQTSNQAYAPPPPPCQPMYNPPTSAPYPTTGNSFPPGNYRATGVPSAYPDQGSFNESSTSNQAKRTSQNSEYSSPPSQTPSNFTGSPSGSSLQRHPNLRPLPTAPVEDETSDEDDYGEGRSTEQITQDAIFADIGNALGATNMTRPRRGNDQRNGDLVDSDLHRYDSRATTINVEPDVNRYPSSASTVGANNHRTTYDEEDDDESDLEAAAGLEAMRIAEEQDSQGWGTGFGYEGQQNSRPESESSDSSYNHMDLSLVGGGYDARMSYGGDIGAQNTGNSSEMEDQSRPLPTPHDLARTDSRGHEPAAGLGGMTDYSYDGHPFPAFEAARVDTYGTGGLQRPSSQNHRLSFDEGDELSLRSRISDSRGSIRSGSDSPSREDPEMLYGSSAFQRPLPFVPPMSENRTPQLMPAGSYRNSLANSQSDSSNDGIRPYVPNGPDGYPPQNMLSPGGQYVPRSSSLTSHSSAPQTVPPVRSKTDSEERQARQRAAKQAGLRSASGLDGYDVGGTPSSVPLDLPALPAGRRKKFQPSRLSSSDFDKCKELWALSGLAGWTREMAGGESGEGEADLRSRTIEEGLVALFTHKVPTMNTADAEMLSSKIVASMFDAGILMHDEEWVKFGYGEINGVLWQLTGSGCYAPMLHNQEIHGRCYSHHCTRTLKKINLHSQTLEPSKKSEDWATFFKVTKEKIESVPKKELERQNNLHEIVMSEDIYMDHLNVLRYIYRDDLSNWQPPIIAKTKINKFIASVFGKVEAIKEANENYLLPQLKYRQKEQGPWLIGFSDIFREWIRKAKHAYIEYAAGFPYASYLVRKEAHKNILFRQFLDQARDNPLSSRLGWDNFLKAPITRLQRYTLLLNTVLKNMTQSTEEKANLATAIEEIKAVTLECDAKVDEQAKKVQMVELQAKLFLRPGMERVELNLDHLGRELIHGGDLQRAGTNRFTWLDSHAILFDHYLVLAKTVIQRENAAGGRKREMYDVSKPPIPMQLLVLESTDDDPEKKSGVKGIGAVTTTVAKPAPQAVPDPRLNRTLTNGLDRASTLEHTNSSNSLTTVNSVTRTLQAQAGDERAMYPFRIKHLGRGEGYTLYAKSPEARQEWCQKILEAKTRHAASLFEQNAEPFRLKVVADTAFACDSMSYISKGVPSIPDTPLDRSIREMEKIYGAGPRPGPVCRASVNCATTFNSFGRQMVAIGTDYGVYTSEISRPRDWSRAIQIQKVTQISVLEEFSLCLIISDKSLIAYHLDVIVPPSSFPAPVHESQRRAPQKLSSNVSFFATARMKDRTLIFFKKKENLQNNTFKVLEPVFQKSSEKKSRFFGSLGASRRLGIGGNIPGAGNTEFFREFDEFYIPTECFTINLFHSYIAISTLRGFELMTLDKKQPVSIPDVKSPAIASIAARINGQKPLGMFRLSDAEFLLCYEECGVYVDKHGDVSRSVVLEFVGRARGAALYGTYLVLFDNDFIEVRNAENGRLRQVIAGKDIRCLDYGVSPLGSGGVSSGANANATQNSGAGGYGSSTFGGVGGGNNPGSASGNQEKERRTLKLAMIHPEIPGNQIVLEMMLNEGHSE